MPQYTERTAKYWIASLGFVILLVTMLLHSGLIGTEAYHNVRLAQDIGLYDDLSFGGRVAAYSWGTPLVLAIAPTLLAYALPLLLGFLSVIVLAKLLEAFTIGRKVREVTLALFVFSPTFIYLFSSANNLFIAFFISLLAFYLFIQDRWKKWSIVCIIVMPLFSIVLTTALLVLLFFYTFFWRKERRKFFSLLLLLGVIVSVAYYSLWIYLAGFPTAINLGESGAFSFFQTVLFDLGSPYGLGMFIMILAMVGLMSVWDRKYSNLFAFFSLFFLLIAVYFRPRLLIFLNLFAVFYAGKGLLYLWKKRWTSVGFKKFTLALLILGVLFSGFSQVVSLSQSLPDEGMQDALRFMGLQQGDVVFSHYSRGVWITSTDHRNVLDENYVFAPDAQERVDDMNALFYSRDLDTSLEIIEKYNIEYIWVDEGFKEEIWDFDTQGLLFIAEYTKSFNKIYDKNGVEIWRIEV